MQWRNKSVHRPTRWRPLQEDSQSRTIYSGQKLRRYRPNYRACKHCQLEPRRTPISPVRRRAATKQPDVTPLVEHHLSYDRHPILHS